MEPILSNALYMDRGTLEDFVVKAHLNADVYLSVFEQIVSGVDYLHSLQPKRLHRDLKPQNILLKRVAAGGFSYGRGQRLVCKLGDLGLSKPLSFTRSLQERNGTFGWNAPEIVNQSKTNEKSDIFPIGLML